MVSAQRPSSRLVGVSTKMYFDIPTTKSYLSKVLSSLPSNLSARVFLLPDFVTLQHCADTAAGTPLIIGAQHTHHEDKGAFTGEVSPLVLAQAGAKFLEIGHAERRRLFAETNDGVVSKCVAAARNKLTPLICVGEVSKEGGVEQAVQECWEQVHAVFASIPKGSPVILAYEPVWAIGASQPATPSHVVAVTQLLREKCANEVGWTGDDLTILYGGSAGPGTYEKIKDGVDGLFLGRFAHDPAAFIRTIEEIQNA
jgi:triosephosphate isomerase